MIASLIISSVNHFYVFMNTEEIAFRKYNDNFITAVKVDNRTERIYRFSEKPESRILLKEAGVNTENKSFAINEGNLIEYSSIDKKIKIKNIPYGQLKNFFLPLDINAASISDFTELPGIGAKKSDEILRHRNGIGRFEYISQLMEVKGIGIKTFGKIKNMIVVRGEND